MSDNYETVCWCWYGSKSTAQFRRQPTTTTTDTRVSLLLLLLFCFLFLMVSFRIFVCVDFCLTSTKLSSLWLAHKFRSATHMWLCDCVNGIKIFKTKKNKEIKRKTHAETWQLRIVQMRWHLTINGTLLHNRLINDYNIFRNGAKERDSEIRIATQTFEFLSITCWNAFAFFAALTLDKIELYIKLHQKKNNQGKKWW